MVQNGITKLEERAPAQSSVGGYDSFEEKRLAEHQFTVSAETGGSIAKLVLLLCPAGSLYRLVVERVVLTYQWTIYSANRNVQGRLIRLSDDTYDFDALIQTFDQAPPADPESTLVLYSFLPDGLTLRQGDGFNLRMDQVNTAGAYTIVTEYHLQPFDGSNA